MTSAASPIAWPLVAQAETTLKFGPLQPEIHRDLARQQVDQHLDDQERRDPIGPFVVEGLEALAEAADPADARAGDRPDPVGVLRGDDQPGVLEGFAGGVHPKLDEPVDPPRLFGVHDLGRIERRDLTGDLDVVVGGVEAAGSA